MNRSPSARASSLASRAALVCSPRSGFSLNLARKVGCRPSRCALWIIVDNGVDNNGILPRIIPKSALTKT
jgi:hypothetical protein